MSDVITKPLMGKRNTGTWIPLQDTTFTSNGVSNVCLRGWQNEVLDLYEESKLPHTFLNCPTGAGKSKAALALIVKSEKDTKNLVIISAPQKEIGKGFLSSEGVPQKILDHTWMINPMNQLCENSYRNEDGNIARVLEVLKNPRLKDLNDRILICCHATLAILFDRMSDEDKVKYLKGIKLCIDESHHSLSQEDSGNGLGKVVNYFLENEDLSLLMMTATPFRGDRGSLVPEKYADQFCRYDLDYGRHFEENCDGLEFTYNAVLHQYGECYGKVISDLLNPHLERKDKVLIQIPSSNRSISNGKFNDLQMIYDSIGNEQKVDDNGVVLIKWDDKFIRVLDLITEQDRVARLDYLRKNPLKIDIVVGISIIKEGFDWPCANAGILIGSQGSLNAQIQLMGRMFRAFDNKGKNKGQRPVEIHQVFPFIDHEKLNEDETREQINTFMKIVYSALAMELVINPIHIDLPIKKDVNGKELPKQTAKSFLTEQLTDVQYTELMESVMDDYRDWKVNNEDADTTGKLSDIVSGRLTELGINENHEEICEFFNKTFQRTAKFQLMAMNGIDVSHIDIELMEDIEDPIDSILLGMSNGLCGAKDIREFQLLMKPVDTLRRCYELKEWVEKNGNFPNVYSDCTAEKSLGKFVENCKSTYKGANNRRNITDKQIDILESIDGWYWDRLESIRTEKCHQLKEWVIKNNRFPTQLGDGEKDLYRFMKSMKDGFKGKGNVRELSHYHIKILESIPNWTWAGCIDKQLLRSNTLKDWIIDNSRYPSQYATDSTEKRLYNFIMTIRSQKKKNKISGDCLNNIESIPNWKW